MTFNKCFSADITLEQITEEDSTDVIHVQESILQMSFMSRVVGVVGERESYNRN